MIFVTSSDGRLIHVSREWTALTGQLIEESLGNGWMSRVHFGDQAVVEDTIRAAISQGAEFSMRYRLLKSDNSPRWVVAGGVPSFGMEDNRFIGYLGSITELASGATDTISAYGNVGRFVPPAPHPSTLPSSALDMIADYLILAHSLMDGGEVLEALPDVRSALVKVGRELAARTKTDIKLN